MDSKNSVMRTIGYCLPEKKMQKLNWPEFQNLCKIHNFNLVKLDWTRPLEEQGPFNLIIHKLTEQFSLANQGDLEAKRNICELEKFVQNHPEVAVLDSFNNVKRLLDRYKYYSVIHSSKVLSEINVFTPSFAELTSDHVEDNILKLKNAAIKFPFVCKTLVAQGSSDVHKMSIIFNEGGVKDCIQPSVAQTFINHNAVLYKVYCVKDKYVIVERPSLKNFYSCDEETIFFSTCDVSKTGSTSSLTFLDDDDPYKQHKQTPPDRNRVDQIVRTLRQEIGLVLFGFDFVIENSTDRYAIIDVNAFPGYDGFPNFFQCLMSCIIDTLSEHETKLKNDLCFNSKLMSATHCKYNNNNQNEQDLDSGFDTSDSSDEKKKQQLNDKSKIR